MNIIPKPMSVIAADGKFVLDKESGISCGLKGVKDNFNEFVKLAVGYDLKDGDDIKFTLTDSGVFGDQSYKIKISQRGIVVEGAEQGLFYGMVTLKQIIKEYYLGGKCEIPCAVITDKPAFLYRGFMLDCCRHFFEVDFVKKLINLCADLKLNVFHWHLTEDQGWRVEIDEYPNLTAKGSVRAETRGDKTAHGGFYTKAQIRDVVAYAKARYVDIIPEFDMPGHSMAAIAAYPWLSCEGGRTEVATTFGIKPTIMCAGKESTYAFIEKTLGEMAELFPCEYFHIGGDEAIKTLWRACPDCQRVMAENKFATEEQLQAYFTQRVIDMLKKLGKTAVVWNEAANSGELGPDCVLQYWQDGLNPLRVKAEINKGRKVIVSKFTPLYLDYPHGMHPLRSVYKFNPVLSGLNDGAEKNIIGVESPLWTEYVETEAKAEGMIFPRLSAVAETAWFGAKEKSFADFKFRHKTFNGFLDLYNVKYTSLIRSNPDPISGGFKTIKHFLSIIDLDLLRTSSKARRETKIAQKSHKDGEKNDK